MRRGESSRIENLVGGARLHAQLACSARERMFRSTSKARGKAHKAARSGAEQLPFLEELASLLQPESPRLLRGPGEIRSPFAPAKTKPGRGSRSKTNRPHARTTAVRREEPSKKTSRCTPDLPPDACLDPREFLNSAELLFLSQRTSCAAALEKRRAPLTVTHKRGTAVSETVKKQRGKESSTSHSLSQRQRSPSRESARRRSASLSSCWLKESEEKDVQAWLRRKEREITSRRRTEKRERRQEKRKREERARERGEREQQAKMAYQQWKERKASEDRERRRARHKTAQPSSSSSHDYSTLTPSYAGHRVPSYTNTASYKSNATSTKAQILKATPLHSPSSVLDQPQPHMKQLPHLNSIAAKPAAHRLTHQVKFMHSNGQENIIL